MTKEAVIDILDDCLRFGKHVPGHITEWCLKHLKGECCDHKPAQEYLRARFDLPTARPKKSED